MSLAMPLAEIAANLRQSPQFRSLCRDLGAVERLPVPAAALVAELLSRQLQRSLLVVVPHESDALAWVEAAELFGGPAVYFSAPSLSPYQEVDISLQVKAVESMALHAIQTGRLQTVVCTPRSLFRRLPDPTAFRQFVIEIEAGAEHPMESLVEHLTNAGYRRTDLVTEAGEFALRGGVFDLYSPGETAPVRLDMLGDTVESIRSFDVESQRSLEQLPQTTVLPLSLFPCGASSARELARRLVRDGDGDGGVAAAHSLDALLQTGRFPGWENYLPLLAPRTVTLRDWVDGVLVISFSPGVLAAEARRHHERLEADWRARQGKGMLAVPPRALEQPLAKVEDILSASAVRIEDIAASEGVPAIDFETRLTDHFHGQLPRFPREVETARARGERLLLVAPEEHRSRFEQWLSQHKITIGRGGVELVSGELQRGFRLPSAKVAVFGERQLFPRFAPSRPRARPRYGPFVPSLRDLRLGDFVVHADHGIGQFLDLRTVGREAESETTLPPALDTMRAGLAPDEIEVMEVAYADGRRLLIPLSRLDQLQRYSGIEGVAPRLDRLGSTSWVRTKDQVRKGMRKLAGDLVRLYAERQLAKGPAMPPDTDLMRQFEAEFDFEETEDQLASIRAVKDDLERDRPMDRLLCGDVGFGKTEVAMRAAFKVVEGGCQVAVLAPTTILADQHLETFQERFDGYPIRVEMVSRRRSPREIKQIKKDLEAGRIDILVGTHRLLSQDIRLPKLGLLVVDEEQRFGVAQKERLRQLKKNVHVLSMSATPVPRTLQLSLAGVRDLSVIETPPRDRMAVETAILPFSAELIREAVEFERERQGQIYYVFNRVEGIEQFAGYLLETVPDLRLTIGHGQLEENELARRMKAFKRGEFEMLLATTIIENGIDIPSVNTIVVHHAERFGLAQLYQLRGRVGRSNQLAYCYLLVPGESVLSEEAARRLRALREFTELGAGFRVAARDLEIRGAGNLLGPEQSGHIAAVGIETYLKMLEETVRELKGESVEEAPSVAIDLPLPMAIPRDYIGDANLRLEIYQRIAAAEFEESELVAELRDRFGQPPQQVFQLLQVAALKRRAEELRVQSVSLHGSSLQVRLRRDAKVDVDQLVRLVSESPGMSFSPSGVLSVERAAGQGLVQQAQALLEALTG